MMWIHCVYKNLFFVSDKKHGLYSDSKLQIWKLLYKLAKLDCPKQSKRILKFLFSCSERDPFFFIIHNEFGYINRTEPCKDKQDM